MKPANSTARVPFFAQCMARCSSRRTTNKADAAHANNLLNTPLFSAIRRWRSISYKLMSLAPYSDRARRKPSRRRRAVWSVPTPINKDEQPRCYDVSAAALVVAPRYHTSTKPTLLTRATRSAHGCLLLYGTGDPSRTNACRLPHTETVHNEGPADDGAQCCRYQHLTTRKSNRAVTPCRLRRY